MSAVPTRRHAPRPAEDTPAEAQQKHNRVLLHALHTAHPMIYKEKQCFIHTLLFQVKGGDISATVYLMGNSAPIAPELVQLQGDPT